MVKKSVGMTGVSMECFLFLLYRVAIEISIGMTGVLRRALSSPPLYGWDRSERSQEDGFGESVIDESEALIQIRSILNFLLQDECSYLYQESQWIHLLCNGRNTQAIKATVSAKP